MPMTHCLTAFTGNVLQDSGSANDCMVTWGDFNGMSKTKAFCHNGGVVGLGVQVEENCMETRDRMMKISSLINSDNHGIDAYDMRVLKQVCMLSAKRWLLFKNECTYESIMQVRRAGVQ
jgi:hypothetical protein